LKFDNYCTTPLKHFFLLSLFFIDLSLVAQQGNISGNIINAISGEPVAYSNIGIYNSQDSALVDGTTSGETGEFIFDAVEPGKYYLVIKFLGFDDKAISQITLVEAQSVDLGKIELSPNERVLAEVEITGNKATFYNQLDKQTYESDDFLSGKGGTATDVLRNIPSVSINAEGEILYRGTQGFVLLLDGKPVQTDPQLLLNQLPANAIKNIELITTPGAKYDAEGKAGIINIITNRNATDGTYLQTNVKIGMPSIEPYDNAENAPRYGFDFLLNRRKGKWDILLGGSYQRNDISGRREGDVWTLIDDKFTRFPSDGERSFDEKNISGSLIIGYDLSARHQLKASFYAGERTKERTADILYNNAGIQNSTGDTLYTLDYFNENLRIRTGDFFLGSLDHNFQISEQSSLSTSILYEYTLLGGPTTNLNLSWPSLQDTLQDQFNTNDNPLHGIRANLDYQHAFTWGTLQAGYQFRFLDHTGDFFYYDRIIGTSELVLVEEFSSSVDLRRDIHSLYGQWNYETGNWSFEAGLRMEYMNREFDLANNSVDTTLSYDFIKPFPSAKIAYAWESGYAMHLAYSKRVDRTTTFKMNPFPEREHSETLEQGDENLLPEFTDALEFGVDMPIGNQQLFARSYFTTTQNLINRVNTVFNDSILNRIYSNVGTGQSLGFELGGELRPTDWWDVFLGYNIYQYSIDGFFNDAPINTRSWVSSLNLNTTFRIGRTWEIQGTLNYLSRRITAQGEDSRFYQPNLAVKKSFWEDRFSMLLQWQNIDMGLLNSNEQRISTSSPNSFYTTTNYVYEVDMITLNLTYNLNKPLTKNKLIKSEFGEKEF